MLIGDFNSLSALKNELVADEIFIALGTTKKNTPDQKLYYQVDHDYPVLAAKLAKENGARAVFLVSAVGANVTSSIFYVRTKGQTERDIISVGFDNTHIFRPSMILGQRQEKRFLEKVLINVWQFINPLFAGNLSIYKGISAEHIALAMVNAAKQNSGSINIYHWKEITALLQH